MSFRRVCLENYGLDPSHFYTAPELAWKACLKKTGIRLELLLDPDMLLMFERGIRGGITQSVYRWAAANNPYMGSEYDKNKPTKHHAVHYDVTIYERMSKNTLRLFVLIRGGERITCRIS